MRTILVVSIVALAAGCGGSGATSVPFAVYDLEAQRAASGGTTLRCAPTACLGSTRAVVVAGRPKLSGGDVDRSSVKWELDPQTNQPAVYLRFTPDGARRFTQLTKELARRGARKRTPQHFVLAVGDTVYATAYIDYRIDPQGIRGDNGVQLSTATAADAKRVVKLLRG